MINLLKENTLLKFSFLSLIEELEKNMQELEKLPVKTRDNVKFQDYVKSIKDFCEDAVMSASGYEKPKKEKIDLDKIFKEEKNNGKDISNKSK